MFDRLREKYYEKKIKWELRNIEMTPKGTCMKAYLKRALEKEEVFIQAYEDAITEVMNKNSSSRDEAMAIMFTFFNLIENKDNFRVRLKRVPLENE